LYESVDCIVTPHRFEGWGVVQAESLVHAKPLISTPLGGIHEWISDKAYFPLKYSMTDVFGMDWAEQYTAEGNKWAQVDIADLRQKMRLVYENRELATKTGLQGQKEVRDQLNFKKVGELMKNRIAEIYREQNL
jgi:glycosyltransferase involved in cell wall biosynthesis